MNWQIEWQALSARIKGLLDAASFFYGSRGLDSGDSCEVQRFILLREGEKIFDNLNAFSNKHKSVLPDIASGCVNDFLNIDKLKDRSYFKLDNVKGNTQFVLTSLAALQSEFEYIIADTQFVTKRITERAFLHLQRCIVADEDFRKKWNNAFKNHETKCEKLGALHLLSHGVWAFKADATGGRTDLILNEPPKTSEIERTADALVLTEWKRVKARDKLDNKIKEAQKQTEIYNTDVLGGVELRDYRYLVMVSKKRMIMPDDRVIGSVKYKHINIAVDPDSPSRDAKKLGYS